MYDQVIQDVFDKLHIVENLYDKIRIVDPVNKRIIELGKQEESEFPISCFTFWGKNKACVNCVSMRAFHENQTFVKFEYTSNEIYMVTAIPAKINDRTIVIELLKNTTNNMIFEGLGEDNQTSVHAMIDSINLLASKDPLTGIFNRRYIYEKLPVDLINAAISNHSIALIMADIDFFKTVNDTYGHLAGDYVLQTFADILKKGLNRESDWVARYGGEEFLICLPGASKEVAVEIAEGLRKATQDTPMSFGEYGFNITASFGVCHTLPTTGMNIDEIIGCADKYLYEAKHNGRNRVEV